MHTDYHAARAEAQERANRLDRDVGIRRSQEYGRTVFNVTVLPNPQNRCGSDLAAEVVHPEPKAQS